MWMTRAQRNQALFVAAEQGNTRLARRLLQRGRWLRGARLRARLRARNQDGWTALHQAAAYGHDDIVRLLLDSGAEVDAPNYRGVRPLEYAACYGHAGTARLLARRGARHTVHTAAAVGEVGELRRLLDEGRSPDGLDYLGYRPLHWAARHGQLEAARVLLQHGGNPCLNDVNGETPYERAMQWDEAEVAELMREYAGGEPDSESQRLFRHAS